MNTSLTALALKRAVTSKWLIDLSFTPQYPVAIVMFFTERLCLRGFRPEDMENIVKLETDPRVFPSYNTEFWRPAKPDLGELLKKRQYEGAFWSAVVVTREGNEFVGTIGMHLQHDSPNRCPSMFIGVIPEQSGKGYGEEMLRFMLKHAFVELDMHKVWLQVFDGNSPAIKLYRKW